MSINTYHRKWNIKCCTWLFIYAYLYTFFIGLLFLIYWSYLPIRVECFSKTELHILFLFTLVMLGGAPGQLVSFILWPQEIHLFLRMAWKQETMALRFCIFRIQDRPLKSMLSKFALVLMVIMKFPVLSAYLSPHCLKVHWEWGGGLFTGPVGSVSQSMLGSRCPWDTVPLTCEGLWLSLAQPESPGCSPPYVSSPVHLP